MKSVIKKIARDTLLLATLETQKSDSADFHDMAVWQIKEALEQAYEAGKKAGTKEETLPANLDND